MTLISVLATAAALYIASLQLFIFLAVFVYIFGPSLHRRLTLPASMVEESRKATARRWLSTLLGGPASALLLAFLVGLISGDTRPESMDLTIGLGVVAAVGLMYLAHISLTATAALGAVHGRLLARKRLARTAEGA